MRSETQCLCQTRVAGPLFAHVPATTRVAGSFSGPANDQDQWSWLLHQATKTVGFDHLLVHDSHFLALHTACIATLCQMSRCSSGVCCHACLTSSCMTHITGLCHAQHVCADAKLVLLCMFHVVGMRVAHSSDCLHLLLGGFYSPDY